MSEKFACCNTIHVEYNFFSLLELMCGDICFLSCCCCFVRFAAVVFISIRVSLLLLVFAFAEMFAVVRDNEFLNYHTHDANCFCKPCREGHALMYAQAMPFVYLRNQVEVVLPNLRKQQTNITFETTKRQVLLGKVFHDMCLSQLEQLEPTARWLLGVPAVGLASYS